MKNKYTYVIVISLIVASFAAFGRIAGNDFINLDDPGYITDNHIVQSGLNLQNIQWTFTTVVLANWHPLTMISYMLEWNLFGANPTGYHIVSLMLHIGAVIFLFLFLYKSTNHLWPAAFAAALFALHPLRVESVAWVAERKDVLSMFFGMACLWAYSFYCESIKISKYLICLLLFILSLLSKPMMVTLPFLLMLLDFWPFNRWQKAFHDHGKTLYAMKALIYEKIPFFLLALASSIITLWAQNKGGAVSSLKNLPFLDRLGNAIVSYATYLGKMFWPVNLAVFYPYETPLPLLEIVSSAAIIILITFIVLVYIRKLPFLFVGWCWYLGTLLPVIGLVQVGSQAMADRYTYLPSIGIAIMLAWGLPLLLPDKDSNKMILFPTEMIILIAIAFLTWQQCGYWKNTLTINSHALKTTKNNYLAHRYLCATFLNIGNMEDAFYHCNAAIQIIPVYADAHLGRGVCHAKLGRSELALADFREAIRLKPDNADAFNNRAVFYFRKGDKKTGCTDAQKACALGNCQALDTAKIKGYCQQQTYGQKAFLLHHCFCDSCLLCSLWQNSGQ
jgi:protein O-mannosyl-transferase